MESSQRWVLVAVIGICALIVGTLIARDLLREPVSRTVAAPPAAATGEETVRTAVRVTLTACNRTASGRTRMDGYIRNSGNQDLHFVTVQAIWKNNSGLPIDTEVFYALNGGTLPPDQTENFSHTTELMSAAKCNAEPVDWW